MKTKQDETWNCFGQRTSLGRVLTNTPRLMKRKEDDSCNCFGQRTSLGRVLTNYPRLMKRKEDDSPTPSPNAQPLNA